MIKELDFVIEPISATSSKQRCGCYAVSHELLRLHSQQHILVPLKSSDYHVQIVNSIANVTLTQTYVNPTDKFLEVEYKFPINPDACVYRFVAEFVNTRIEGVVKEKEQAKQEYEKAVKEGRKAAFGELYTNSKDILNLKVGNIPPKQTVRIQVIYLQQLTLSCNTFYQLRMAGTISPRYINYIPAEHITAGLRSEGAKTEGNFYWNFRISLRTSRKVIFFDSNTHDIQLVSQNDPCTLSELVMSKSCVPNKDFCFSYTTEDFQLPSCVFGRTDVGSTAMLSFIPKFCPLSIDDAYKASIAGKSFETDIENAKGEYIFLLDRSGSMRNARIEKAKEALVLFLKSLPEDTYFNVVSFGSHSQQMFPSSVKYSNNEVNMAVQKIKEMSANMGGTQIYHPLLQLITQKPKEGYPKQIFLLTDGGVSNTQGVITMVGSNNKYSRVHTIGIGNGCSEDLILGCAKKGKGHHVFIADNENPSQKIIQLLTDSFSPIISGMKLIFDKDIVESIIPNPQSLPYILKGEIVNFYITFKGQLDKNIAFSFSYEDTLNKLPYQSELIVSPNNENQAFIDRMSHFRRIRLLEESQSANLNIEDQMFYVKVLDKKGEIIKESVKHQILSVHTAFICVEKELIDGRYQEVKGKGQSTVMVQNPQPLQYYQPLIRLGKGGYPAPQLRLGKDLCTASNLGGSSPLKSSFNTSKPFGGLSVKQQHGRWKMAPERKVMPRGRDRDREDNYNMCFKIQSDQAMMDSKPEEITIITSQKIPAQDAMKRSSKFQFKEYKQQQRKMEIKPLLKSVKLSIDELISCQSIEGSWKDLSLVEILFSKEIRENISKEQNISAVITYLICKWIQKHHPEKKYSLIVKKGFNFIKKNSENFQKFGQLYDQYVA